MPTENDPKTAVPAPKKIVVTNDVSTLSLGTTGQADEFTGERLDLPSRGLLYPQGHPAAQGWIMVRPITTKEEEILVTERFHKQGVAIDMILSRCILTKGINTLDLLSGDRLHILFYLRAISYGPEYSFRTRMRDGSEQEIKTDVSKLTIVTLPDGFAEPWIAQIDGTTYELRLSRGKDEQEAIVEQMRNKKKSPNAPNSAPTDALRRQIVSVNGDTDRDNIVKHVNRMIAKTAHALRAEIVKNAPGPQLKIDVVNQETGEPEEISVSITESFFVPSLDPAQQWESRKGLDTQVFVMTTDGGLNRWEVMNMTNVQRKIWIQMITAKAKAQKEAHEKARSNSSGPKTING